MSIEVKAKDGIYTIKPTQEDIDNAKLEHDNVHLLELAGEGYELEFIVKPLRAATQRAFMKEASEKRFSKAMREAFLDCTVFPKREHLVKVIDALPNIPASAMEYIQEISGDAKVKQGKRL